MRGPSTDVDDALYEVLSLSLEHVGIKTLARFGASSRRCRKLSKSLCQQHTRQLLPPLVKLAALTGLEASSTDDKVVAAIDWVVACAAADALAGLADTLLAIPRVPRTITFKLINCGVCVGWEQLKAAAKNRIAGTEGWGTGSLMPLMVVAVCSTPVEQLTRDEFWLRTPASDVPDLLHLAVNSQKPEAAQSLLQLLQDEYKAEPAHQMQQLRSFHHQNEQNYQYRILLQQLEAYQRRGWCLPPILQRYKRQQQEMQQAWDAMQQRHQREQQQLRDRPQQLKQLLTTDLVVELLRTAALRGHWAVIGQLFELDAARYITADVAAELLHAAVQARSLVGLEVIIKHEAAKQISADELCSLMQSALSTVLQCAWPTLMELPAAAAINAADVLQLLRQSIEMRDILAVHKVCNLSGASTLNADEIIGLLQLAIARSVSSVVEDLLELPGAQLIPIDSMVLLLESAMQQEETTAVEELMKMDVVNELDAQQLSQLCDLAMTASTDSTCVELLLQLPATGDFDVMHVDELVKAALLQSKRNPAYRSSSSFDSLRAVVQLSVAHVLNPSRICECLEQLLHVPGSDDLIDMLCGLNSAQYGFFGVSDGLGILILMAVRLQRFAAANSLSKLTYFDVVSTQVLQDLLSMAIQQKQEDLVVKVCHGAAAERLPCSALVSMLHVATRQRLCNVVECLLGLVKYSDMCGDLLAGLIKEELNAVDSCASHAVSCILNNYIALDAAAPMHLSQIADLMSLAIQMQKDYAVVQLCKLPGAQTPHAWQLVSSVLHATLQRGDAWMQPLHSDSVIVVVCQLPAAKYISATTLDLLMRAAIRVRRTQSFLQLCQLPAAAELGANVVVELGVIAMQCASTGVVAVLSTLPGAALTTRQDIMCLLRKAIATDDVSVSAMVDCEVVGSVLTMFGCSKLGAAEKLFTEDVADLLLMCLQEPGSSRASQHIEALSKLPAAQQLSPNQLSSLLQIAVKLGRYSELRSLCLLHETVLGPMSDDLINKLLNAADTCMPKCNAELLEVLGGLRRYQMLSGFVFDLH